MRTAAPLPKTGGAVLTLLRSPDRQDRVHARGMGSRDFQLPRSGALRLFAQLLLLQSAGADAPPGAQMMSPQVPPDVHGRRGQDLPAQSSASSPSDSPLSSLSAAEGLTCPAGWFIESGAGTSPPPANRRHLQLSGEGLVDWFDSSVNCGLPAMRAFGWTVDANHEDWNCAGGGYFGFYDSIKPNGNEGLVPSTRSGSLRLQCTLHTSVCPLEQGTT